MSFNYTEASKLFSTNDHFGANVDVNDAGDRFIAGSWFSNPPSPGSPSLAMGHVSVWDASGTSWVESAQLVASDSSGTYGLYGWDIALSGDGETAVVTARTDGAANSGESGANHTAGTLGSAWVFTRSPTAGTWYQQGSRFGPASFTHTGGFGEYGGACCISYDGNTMAVGQVNKSSGTVFVYTRDGSGSWSTQATINNSGMMALGDGLAFADDAGDTLLVGNALASGTIGEVRAYTRSGGVWSLEQTVSPPSGGTWHAFGFGLDTSNDGLTMCVAQFNPQAPGGAWTNGLFIYNRATVGGAWTHNTTLSPPTWGASFNSMRYETALNGDGTKLLVGPSEVTGDGGGGIGTNGTVVYYENSGGWSSVATFQPSDVNGGAGARAAFGCGLAMPPGDEFFLAGGFGDIEAGGTFGAVWYYTRPVTAAARAFYEQWGAIAL